ncbi:MAG: isoleucine--tRNA ligase [Candidatus Synoicihabitans palmerolidicus]|nr:isoleucine--tRNA ligase [Candidatus Synoicihabitans palmerolidicus]
MAQDLKNTLLLPKTDFPMRANLITREPKRLAHWDKLDLYKAMQSLRANAPTFVLHDGPPFTNGDVHIGTALNKSLKDIVCRYKTMRGFRTPYVPGWDCHGLPIEQKVAREIQESGEEVSTADRRARCDAFSERWIGIQREQFKRLGVQADWAHEYKTKAPAYEVDIIRTFASFVAQGIVYRSKKPIYWSIPFETALAEAEIEYKDHVSPVIWVKFVVPTAEGEKFDLPTDKPLSVVIWTTTSWTIPANLAIAVHPRVDYVVVDLGAERILVAAALLSAVLTAAKIDGETPIVQTVTGQKLENLATRHPFIDRASPVVLAEYVTTESGTGCVHTAPGHGADDYLTGLNYKLDIYCPVGDNGCYLDDGQVPSELVGLSCLESVEDMAAKKTSTANIGVLKLLAAHNALFAKARYPHSYPHCWRSKTPIIFRAVDQWFVSLDQAHHRPQALEAIAGVRWIPGWGESRIKGVVEARPDWCISRQRSWGVPIIAFYDADTMPYIDANVIQAVADKIATRGTNFWYDATAAEILEGVRLPTRWPTPDDLTCGRDTLDVWIDSGSSHNAVLRNGQGATSWPADLYLEGSDQHRGWFQSSLWTSIISRGAAPYKAVLTHGFIVGEDGKKISKSGSYEKPPTSDNYIAQFGADVIRLWIASQDFTQDITLSDKIIRIAGDAYRLFRNTFRYQLSTQFDFDPAQHSVPVDAMDTLDRWALHQTALLTEACTVAYDAYEFHRVQQLCNHFCSVTLSSVYHDILKDRLYTFAADHPQRRSSQTTIRHIFNTLVRLLAPVLNFTTDEAWAHSTTGTDFTSDSIHLQDWPVIPADWKNPGLDAEVSALLKIRGQVTEAIEPARQAGKIGKSLDATVTLTLAHGDQETAAVLQKHQDFLPELFIVSRVSLAPADPSPAALQIGVTHCQEHQDVRCPRCWRWVPTLSAGPNGETCPRCAEALG